MSPSHLVAFGNFAFLRNINTNQLIDSRHQLIAIFTGENFDIDNFAGFTVRNPQRSVSHFTGLLAKNRPQQTFFGRQFRLALWRDLTDQNIAGSNFSANSDNAAIIQIAQCFFSHIRNVPGDFFRPQFGITRVALIFFDVNRSKDIFFDNLFT